MRRIINSKEKEIFKCEISVIILIYQKLGSVGSVQQKIKLSSPKKEVVTQRIENL